MGKSSNNKDKIFVILQGRFANLALMTRDELSINYNN